MKQLLLGLNMLLMVGAMSFAHLDSAYAQESDAIVIGVGATSSDQTEVTEEDDGFNISINLGDEEDSAEKKLKNAVTTLSKVIGKEISDDIAIELEGMSEDEKEQIVVALSNGFSFDSHDSGGISVREFLIAFTAIVLIFGMPVFILIILLMFGSRKRRQKMDLVRTYLDAGKDVPEEVLAEFSGGGTNSLKRGVTPLAIGAGMIAASFILGETALAAFGLIPLFIGIARLVYWKYETKPTDLAN
ncbi:MAG: hypothetical protein ACI9FR_000050 [Cryomorphaceae bacterium]|jgi:hypothetical protein